MVEIVRGEVERFSAEGGVKLKGIEKYYWPSIFVPQQEKDVVKGWVVGDEVQFVPTVSKDGFSHISQPVLIKKAEPIIPMSQAVGQTIKQVVDNIVEKERKPDWDAKDRRIVRMNCITNTVNLFNKEGLKIEDNQSIMQGILQFASMFEEWVYRV